MVTGVHGVHGVLVTMKSRKQELDLVIIHRHQREEDSVKESHQRQLVVQRNPLVLMDGPLLMVNVINISLSRSHGTMLKSFALITR